LLTETFDFSKVSNTLKIFIKVINLISPVGNKKKEYGKTWTSEYIPGVGLGG
jgi:hypothetical protein